MTKGRPAPGGYGNSLAALGAKGGKLSPEMLARIMAMLKAQQGGRPPMPMGGGMPGPMMGGR